MSKIQEIVEDYINYFDKYYKDSLLNTDVHSDRYNGFKIMFEELLKKKGSNFNIIETGTIRNPNNWRDGQSTLLFYDFLRHYSGNLITIDINNNYLNMCREFILNYIFPDKVSYTPVFSQINGDSVLKLNNLSNSVDLVYLDSFDLDLLNPEPSMVHHLKEVISLNKIINSSENLIIAVDDNFSNVGKGKYVMDWAKSVNADILYEGYQVIFKL